MIDQVQYDLNRYEGKGRRTMARMLKLTKLVGIYCKQRVSHYLFLGVLP